MSARLFLVLGAVLTAALLATSYRLLGLGATVQLLFALVIGVFASYVAALIFSRTVQVTIWEITGLDEQVRSLLRDVRELVKLRGQLEDIAFSLSPEDRAQVRDVIRKLEDLHSRVKETVDRMDQSIKVFSRIEGRR